jgi:ABC-type oligopeptide transport system, periplasmic component
MTKRSFHLILLTGALAAVVLFGAAACGGKKDNTAPSSARPPQAPLDQQNLVIQGGEPEFLDPQLSRVQQDLAIERMLFRGLYQFVVADDGAIQAEPAMAAGDPEVSGNVYTVRLKDGLKWSDGQPLTAADFEYSFKRECSPETASPYQYLLGASTLNIIGCDDYFAAVDKSPAEQAALRDQVGVKAVDDTTLQITLAAPKPLFTTYLSLWAAYPVRKDVVEKYGEKWTNPGNIVGNGPFILADYVPQDHMTLIPNPNWALDPKPKVQQLTVKFIDDTEAAFRAFQTGELEMVQVPPAELPVVQQDSTLKSELLTLPALRIWAIDTQLSNDVLKNFDVRLALSRAIDRKTLVDVLYNGAYTPATYWTMEGLPGYQGNAAFDNLIGYDPEAAKKALADAGYPNGQGFPTLKMTVLDRPDKKAEAEFLVKAWKTVLGIDVSVDAMDSRTLGQLFGTKSFELLPGGFQNDYPDPENSLIGQFNSDGENNLWDCNDAGIDTKLKAAATETDNEKRITLLQDAETLVIGKLCGVIPLYQPDFLYLVSPEIGGVKASGALDMAMPGNWCPECWFVKAQP